MKKIMFFFVLTNMLVHSQNAMEYLGAIKLNDSSVITYKIKFTSFNGLIKGYSLTDFGGAHETKSSISGFYNESTKSLAFKETHIIYTKSPISENDFCFINFLPVKFKLHKTKHFKGPFKGKFPDGETCINGEIYLNSVEQISKQIKKVSKLVNKSKKLNDSIKAEFNQVKLLDSVNLNILKKNQITSIFSNMEYVKLRIFDGGKLDDDKIMLKINGKIKLLNYTVEKTEKEILIPLEGKKTEIIVLAKSIGAIGKNTTMITIDDGEQVINTLTNLDLNEQTVIHVLRR